MLEVAIDDVPVASVRQPEKTRSAQTMAPAVAVEFGQLRPERVAARARG